jgi:YHS domain-containing protein
MNHIVERSKLTDTPETRRRKRVRKYNYFGINLLAALAVIGALVFVAGCGSKQKTETQATGKTAAGTESGTYAEQKTGSSEAPAAVDWSEFSNPKPGVDPVCGMSLDPAYVTEVMIADKKYACCSSRCADMLAQNPDQYLGAAASTTGESPQGHTE